MKTFPVGLDILLATRSYVFCDLYDFTLQDGTHLYYTTADTDVSYAGNIYTSQGPFFDQVSSQARGHWKAGLDLDTWQVAIRPTTEDPITGVAFPAKIYNQPWLVAARVGALDGATVRVHRAYWAVWPTRPFSVVNVGLEQPSAAVLSLTGTTPTIQSPLASQPAAATLPLTTTIPVLRQLIVIRPSAATLSLLANFPVIASAGFYTPASASLSLDANLPRVPILIMVPPRTLALIGNAPNVVLAGIIRPANASLSLTGVAPTVIATANIFITPNVGTLSLVASTPISITTIRPSAATLSLTSNPPVVGVTAPLSLDGSASNTAASTAAPTVTLTTTLVNDIIVVFVSTTKISPASTVTSITDTAGLTWTKRSSFEYTSGTRFNLEVWWAPSTGVLSSDVITANLGATATQTVMIAFGVNGANFAAPWDTNGTLPATATSTGTPTVSGVSTTNANTMLLGFENHASTAADTAGSGYTLIKNQAASSIMDAAAQQKIVSATQSSVAVAFGTSFGATAWGMIADAIRGG